MTGTVGAFFERKGFGFIRRPAGEKDIFFHVSNVEGRVNLAEGMQVEYQIKQTAKGPEAVSIQPTDRTDSDEHNSQ